MYCWNYNNRLLFWDDTLTRGILTLLEGLWIWLQNNKQVIITDTVWLKHLQLKKCKEVE